MKCPKCGTENSSKAKFCSECGYNIEVERFTCPNCHLFVKKGSKFCANCGKELKWPEVDYNSIPIPAKETTREPLSDEEKRKVTGNVFKYIISSVFFLAILFFIIGSLGAVYAAHITGNPDTQVNSLTYYFKDAFTEIKQLKDLYPSKKYYYFELMLLILDLTAYYLMLIAVILVSIFFIINLVKHLMGIEKIKWSLPILGLSFVLTHLLVVSFRYFNLVTSGSSKVDIGYGWGSALLLTGCVLILLCFVLQRISHHIAYKDNKKEVVHCSLHSAANVLGFITLLLIFGLSITTTMSSYYSSQSVDSSFAMTMRIFLASGGSLPKKFYVSMVGFIIACVGGLISLISFALCLKKVSLGRMIFYIGSQVVMLTGFFINIFAFEKAYESSTISVGGVFTIILSIFSIGLLVASFFLMDKDKMQIEE